MKKMVFAGALALAMVGSSVFAVAPVSAQQLASASAGVSAAHIGQLKAALNLTPEQEAHWPAVESALRQIRSSFDAAALKRALAAARPLIKSLDEKQKRTAMRLAHSLGLSQVAAAF